VISFGYLEVGMDECGAREINHLVLHNLPWGLSGKTALGIGAASGDSSFELERRGAKVAATDSTQWADHNFGRASERARFIRTMRCAHQGWDRVWRKS